MDRFVLLLSPSATRDLDDLDDPIVRNILAALPELQEVPFPRGKLVKKIKGKRSTFYRLRVDKFRILYSIEGTKIVVLRVIGKKDTERYLKTLK